jgi:hypothetical protein
MFHDVQAFVDVSAKAKTLGWLQILVEGMTHNLGFDFYALVQHGYPTGRVPRCGVGRLP